MSDSSRPVNGQRCHLELGNDVFVVASTWRGVLKIHVREYRRSGEKYIPTKRGITLTLQRWNELVSNRSRIEETIEGGEGGEGGEFKCHLGGNVYANMQSDYPGLDIRKWYWNGEEDTIKPYSRPGIKLLPNQLESLLHCFIALPDYVPELNITVPCYMEADHMNQMGYYMCSECNPNGLSVWN
ncbi:uncharacterized protein [Haliotis cracherodii]|uniref:uncharacterized protein n=1 Tax=Haliotis cracherodii TaxID=6455 RepID=UPI0039EAFE1F